MKTKSTPSVLSVYWSLCFVFIAVGNSFSQVPRPDHVVVCIMENHPNVGLSSSASIIGNSSAPYINALTTDSGSANFTMTYGVEHPSQPNYLDFFSGSNQGITNDNVPPSYPFSTDNLARELLDSSLTFITYSEDLPSVGFDQDAGSYKRKHNPVTNWAGTGTNQVPAELNQPLTAFPSPTGYDSLPTVSYVIPNQDNDMHNGSDPARIGVGDAWLQSHLDSYIQWAKTHNSLFILTWDEDDGFSVTLDNHIVTVFTGEMVKTGQYPESINHFTVLRTIEDMYHLRHAGQAANKSPIIDCWKSLPNAIGELNASASTWSVYPNPVKDRVYVERNNTNTQSAELQVQDITGRTLLTTLVQQQKQEVDLSALPSGVYFLKFKDEPGSGSYKLVKE